MKKSPRLITIAEAMRLLGVTRPTVNAMVMREQIKAEKGDGDKWMIVRASLPSPAERDQ
jgi:excisionase family DNA binding protein